MELPADDEALDGGSTKLRPQLSESGDEQASVSIRAGDDSRTIEFLTTALLENEIPVRAVNEGALTIVYVRPSYAACAREIVREITEGIPPQ